VKIGRSFGRLIFIYADYLFLGGSAGVGIAMSVLAWYNKSYDFNEENTGYSFMLAQASGDGGRGRCFMAVVGFSGRNW
jgi:hypothetical protein